ncbi:10396_t:CDS:2 [Diversispora eburnea]|uniref:10396_t:CDS:1 n=1 Tax=Diversispora eburnea TaxID=1213867 RepID=A0A9N9AKT5_9GLOM|nr:10396_t:CDS:2 [Diversispora eburnea]
MELVASAAEIYHTKDPGIFVLLSGCGGYNPLIFKAVERNWKIKIWSWSSALPGKNHTLALTGETVGKWGNDEIMKCFCFTIIICSMV